MKEKKMAGWLAGWASSSFVCPKPALSVCCGSLLAWIRLIGGQHATWATGNWEKWENMVGKLAPTLTRNV